MRITFYVAGTRFRSERYDKTGTFLNGEGLQLELEPTNPHDPRAIKVLHQGQHLGYVPKTTIQQTNLDLLVESPFVSHKAILVGYFPEEKTEKRFLVEIKITL